MSKDLIFDEKLCQYLDLFNSIDEDSLKECCNFSLQILDSDKQISEKLLSKAAKRLNLDAKALQNGLKALSILFLEITKQLRSPNKILTSLEMLRIPSADILTKFWKEEVRPKIGK